jgi:hypothetical protein
MLTKNDGDGDKISYLTIENSFYEDSENEEDLLDDDIVLTISSSEVARRMSLEVPEGSDERNLFGSQFEQAYQTLCYQISKSMFYSIPSLLDDFEARFEDSPYQDEAREIAEAFLNAGIIGLTPKTQFRAISKTRYIAAKPDLYNSLNGQYYEFKIYPLCEYSRNQARVFSWVVRQPVFLVGFNAGKVEIEKISTEELIFPKIPRGVYTETPRDRVDEEDGPFHRKHYSFGRNQYESIYIDFDEEDDWDVDNLYEYEDDDEIEDEEW